MRINSSLIYAIATAAVLCLATGCVGNSATPVDVVIQLPGPAQTLSKAVIEVDYSRSGAVPAGGRRPSCTALLPYLDATFSDDGRNRLIIDVSSPQGFSAPADLVACRMLASKGNEDAGRIQSRLAVRVDSALDMAGQAVGDKRLAGLSSRIQTRADRHAPREEAGKSSQQRRNARSAESRERGASADQAATERASASGVRELRPSGRPAAAPEGRPAGRIASAAADTGAAATAERSRAGSPRDAVRDAVAGAARANAPSGGGPLDDGASAADSGLGRANTEIPSGVVPNVGPTYSYEITLSVLNDSGELGALQVDVSNSSGGGFVGNGDSVDCTSLLGGALVAFNNRDGKLRAGFIATNGIATPTPIASCRYKSRTDVTSGSFSVAVTDSSDTNSQPASPTPFVAVSDVQLIR